MRSLLGQLLFGSVLASATMQLLAQQDASEAASFSCKQFPPDLSEAYLIERFGRQNVIDEPVFAFDDGPSPGTVVFGDNPNRRVEIAWRDADAKAGPIWVRLREEATEWQTLDGISVGMTLKEVEALNGWPFRLGGFMVEQGQGRVRTWGSGRLAESSEADCPVTVQFQPRRHEAADFSLAHELNRGSDFSSCHFAMQGTNPLVVSLWIFYGD